MTETITRGQLGRVVEETHGKVYLPAGEDVTKLNEWARTVTSFSVGSYSQWIDGEKHDCPITAVFGFDHIRTEDKKHDWALAFDRALRRTRSLSGTLFTGSVLEVVDD